MPLFKFGYVDPTLRYAELQIEARVTPWFTLDHVPDAGVFDFPVHLDLLFDLVLPEDISIPLVTMLFEAESDSVLTGTLLFSLPSIEFYFLSEESLTSNFTLDIRPVFDFEVLAPNLNAAGLLLKVPRIIPDFYVYAPIIGEFFLNFGPVLPEFELYEATRATLSLRLRGIDVNLAAGMQDLQTLSLRFPLPTFLFRGFSGQSEAELFIDFPMPIFDLFCGQSLAQIDDGVIRFDYEPYMFELLKSVRPEYEAITIRFDLEQED